MDVDLVVVGLGPGGEAVADGAARAGLSVAGVEANLVGGECPYYGCIPSKMMVRAADALAEAGRADELAGRVNTTPDWSPVAKRVSEEGTSGWDDTIALRRLEDAGATVHRGTGRLAGPRQVVVDLHDGGTVELTASRGVVLDPGTRPTVPPVPGLEGTPYWTNREAVQATRLPGSLVVLGAGPVGCELAQVFARFGVDTTLVQRGPRLLPADEPAAGELLEQVLTEEGLQVLTGTELTHVAHGAEGFRLTVGDEEVVAEQLLVAGGRTPNLDDLGLETVGLDPSARNLDADEWMRVAEGLWAVGDVVGHGAFTHMSTYEAGVALRDVLGQGGQPAEYHAVPHTTFTDPEVAGVGLTEQRARDAGLSVRVGTTPLESSPRGFTHGPGSRGLVTVVEDADRGVLVGATVVGPSGGEILGPLAVAVHARVPVSTLRGMIWTFPTFIRAIDSALADLG